MKKINYFVLCILIIGTTSCASIIHGSYQEVSFSSTPSGAKVYIDGKSMGSTPINVSLRRMGREKGAPNTQKEYSVKVELPGYFPYEMKIKREMDSWYLGNILFGGFIGLIVDAANGAMYKLTPDQVIAQLQKDNTPIAQLDKDHLNIFVTLDADPSWEKVGQLETR